MRASPLSHTKLNFILKNTLSENLNMRGVMRPYLRLSIRQQEHRNWELILQFMTV